MKGPPRRCTRRARSTSPSGRLRQLASLPFGGSLERRASILRVIRDAVAERAGEDYACTVKIPHEKAPPFMAHATFDDALRMCELAAEWGFHAVTPVEVSVFPDTTLSRGGIPKSLWSNKAISKRMRDATRSRLRLDVITAGYFLGGITAPFTPVWMRVALVLVTGPAMMGGALIRKKAKE